MSTSCKRLEISSCVIVVWKRVSCFPPLSAYQFRFQDIKEACTWLRVWLDASFPKGRRPPPPPPTPHLRFCLQCISLGPTGLFYSTAFQRAAPRLDSLFDGVTIYYCSMAGSTASWKINKCFLAALCSAHLFIQLPLSRCPSSVPSTFFPSHWLPFCSVSFISCSSAFQWNPNPKPTHPLSHIALGD